MSDAPAPDRTVSGCTRCGGPLHGNTTGMCPLCTAGATAATAAPEPPLPEGTVFRGLVIEGVLGKGGMGVVYKARQPGLDRHVAVKILPKALSADPEFVKRFLREGKAMASLTHPNIVAIYDFGQEGERHFIVMEFVDGLNLRVLIREKQLNSGEALAVIPQVCDALQYAHGEGVVHRDIKPENILLDKKGRVKIADFGLAKVLGDQTRAEALTVTNMVMGTPNYMAPEQLENPKAVDHRADLYSLGVVLYEMLTGELPVGRFDPPSKRAKMDVRLDQVVMRALEKHAERRYQDAASIKTDVTRITQGVPAASASTRGLVLALGAAVVALAVVLVVVLARKGPVASPSPTATLAAPTATPEPDWFAGSRIRDEELPRDWKHPAATFDSTDPGEILQRVNYLGLGDGAKRLKRVRLEVVGAERHEHVQAWTLEFDSEESAAAGLQALATKHKDGSPGLVAVKRVVFFGWAGFQLPVKVSLVLQKIEDLVRSRWGAAPAQRRGPSLVIAEDLPPGWQRAKAWKGESLPITDPAKVLGDLAAWWKVDPETVWDVECSAVGPAAEPEAVRILSVRCTDSEPVAEFQVKGRTIGEPEGIARAEIFAENHRLAVVALHSKSPEAQSGFDTLTRRIGDRIDYGHGLKLEPKVRVDRVRVVDSEIEIVFDLMGASLRRLKERGTWKHKLQMGWATAIEWDAPPPADLTRQGPVVRAVVKVPVDDRVARALELRPSSLNLEIAFDLPDEADPIKLNHGLEPETFPKRFLDGLGRYALNGNDLPTGWEYRWRDDDEHFPRWCDSEKELDWLAEELKGLAPLAGSSLRAGFLYALAPKQWKKGGAGFEALRVAVLHMPEEASRVAFLGKARAVTAMSGSDRHVVIASGAFVAVAWLRGTDAAAIEGFDRFAALLRRKLGVE